MFIKAMRAKIHRATITQTDLDYVGSITIDEDLLRAVGLVPNEVVTVADIDNGNRFETYIIRGEAGSGIIGVNGAAAHLVNLGDQVIIFASGYFQADEVESHQAKVVVVDEQNAIVERLSYSSSMAEPELEAVVDSHEA